MTQIIVDEALRSKLNGLNAEIEFRDSSGKTIGHFLPEQAYKELLSAWAKVSITDEEVQRARQQTGGRSLAEIWKSLGRT